MFFVFRNNHIIASSKMNSTSIDTEKALEIFRLGISGCDKKGGGGYF
jgi:hypothetical protein